MKKVLFIDRDGTLITEPEDFQIDSFEKLEFFPGVFRYLGRIAEEMDFLLVMVTNQDGLGTDSFPEDTFWPVHQLLLKTLENEGIEFEEILIDRSFPEDNAPGRKPRTGMLTHYLEGDYDLSGSFVIGDRPSDMELAKNLGARGIWLADSEMEKATDSDWGRQVALKTDSWKEIYHFLRLPQRSSRIHRKTKETDITIALSLDGSGQAHNETGIAFFDHMLDQLARHSGCDLSVTARGDLEVDEHHTIEDTALALGEAFQTALGEKAGIERYGFCLPMDDALAQVAID
ncbi:MAG: histidinol-phosphatase, partial [Saprospiraceae bacterium]|nr:histidinol-phosphatase [Saprospiraceae bacterium]